MAKRKQRKAQVKAKKTQTEQKLIADARLKLIAKRRTDISDARIRLKQLEVRKSQVTSSSSQSLHFDSTALKGHPKNRKLILKSIGKGIIMKKDGKGKISLQTTKNRLKSSESSQKNSDKGRSKFVSKYRVKYRNNGLKKDDSNEKSGHEIFRRTIRNELANRDIEPSSSVQHVSLSKKAPLTRNPYVWVRESTFDKKYSNTMDIDDEGLTCQNNSPIYSPMYLNTTRKQQLDHKNPITKTIWNATNKNTERFRIYVSNLQSTVTHEDILELFEDIGELISAKFVKPGVAEVIYKDYHSAKMAVDIYHNRQLDGEPMKCTLVENSERSPTVTLNTRFLGTSDGGNKQTLIGSINNGTGNHSKFVPSPDIDTIHKVLFNRT